MMNFIMVILFMIFNNMFMMIKHPMALNSIIFMQLLISCFIFNFMINNSWFSYILFIMFIGGLMILFMYMCSISSNLKFKINFKLMMTMIMILIIIIFIMMNMKNLFFFYKLNNLNYNTVNMMNNKMMLFKLYEKNSLMISLITIHMLLFLMIFSTKMMKNFQGPLRKKY
uniref:NADH dehydrogenase subunit 6 n=1 Tax=Tinodes chinchinus TaxID=2904900 RepID=A0A9E8RU24_9NEOP|nr:NADH dehydrogenase subunit 6 [Tinodes chinchinus]UZZ44426.1 NADH dehydrogenase subunit 6 [Tinodes chinchinus]